MSKSNIEWTEFSWNPTTGCTKISQGCKNCYAEQMAARLNAMGAKGYENNFKLTLHPDRLNEPAGRKKPSIYFVCSMSDLFHDDVPTEYLDKVFTTIANTPQHIYQVLSKRPERMRDYFSNRKTPPNVWLGVSVENKKQGLQRIDILREISVSIRFLSIEPLLEDLGELDLQGIHWVIVGGESGAKARRMEESWVINIQKQCEKSAVPFFFKQWGAFSPDGKKASKSANGKMLDGKIWQEMPSLPKNNMANNELPLFR